MRSHYLSKALEVLVSMPETITTTTVEVLLSIPEVIRSFTGVSFARKTCMGLVGLTTPLPGQKVWGRSFSARHAAAQGAATTGGRARNSGRRRWGRETGGAGRGRPSGIVDSCSCVLWDCGFVHRLTLVSSWRPAGKILRACIAEHNLASVIRSTYLLGE